MENTLALSREFDRLVEERRAMDRRLRPYLEEYLQFLLAEKPSHDYLIYPYVEFEADGGLFELDATKSDPRGIWYNLPTFDGQEGLLLSYGFLDCPREWKQNVMQKINADRLVAEAAFKDSFGPDDKRFIRDVSPYRTHRDFVIVRVSESDDPKSFSAKDEFFVVNRRTGLMYAGTNLVSIGLANWPALNKPE